MTSKDESLGPLKVLRKRLQEMADELKIELNSLAFMVGDEGDSSDVAQVVFILTPEALKSAEELEQARYDEEFQRMMAGDTVIEKAQDTIKGDSLDLWEDDE